MVYLSCDRGRERFIAKVETAVDELNVTLNNTIELVYPSGDDGSGFVARNVLRLQEADVVVFDVTPSSATGSAVYNPGVMIEYGIFLSLERPLSGIPWGGKQPKPAHRVYCENVFSRSTLTPILNESAVRTYETSDSGLDALALEIRTLLSSQVSALIAFASKVNASMAVTPQLYKYQFNATTS